jgi:hypothetical protein
MLVTVSYPNFEQRILAREPHSELATFLDLEGN